MESRVEPASGPGAASCKALWGSWPEVALVALERDRRKRTNFILEKEGRTCHSPMMWARVRKDQGH